MPKPVNIYTEYFPWQTWSKNETSIMLLLLRAANKAQATTNFTK